MAIDTARRRKSASSIRPFRRAYSSTSGINTRDDRAQITGAYVQGEDAPAPGGLIQTWIPSGRGTQWGLLDRPIIWLPRKRRTKWNPE